MGKKKPSRWQRFKTWYTGGDSFNKQLTSAKKHQKKYGKHSLHNIPRKYR